ncbi:hypothetical protein [Phaeodactylibacter luteus]|uniref:hypothetical protein n=1 Tax=Phaeodactylibacter luteus TaxID=1564516 RepID=UPI0014796756|nr:hypothetical protein [Phaeodactylibacter luteus]
MEFLVMEYFVLPALQAPYTQKNAALFDKFTQARAKAGQRLIFLRLCHRQALILGL